jgi:hypothetical protein
MSLHKGVQVTLCAMAPPKSVDAANASRQKGAREALPTARGVVLRRGAKPMTLTAMECSLQFASRELHSTTKWQWKWQWQWQWQWHRDSCTVNSHCAIAVNMGPEDVAVQWFVVR